MGPACFVYCTACASCIHCVQSIAKDSLNPGHSSSCQVLTQWKVSMMPTSKMTWKERIRNTLCTLYRTVRIPFHIPSARGLSCSCTPSLLALFSRFLGSWPPKDDQNAGNKCKGCYDEENHPPPLHNADDLRTRAQQRLCSHMKAGKITIDMVG